jgi:anti-sigma factor RsiW
MLNELRRERSPECITDLGFDEWAAGELSAEDAERFSAHVAMCDQCAGRKRALEARAQAFLVRAPELISRGTHRRGAGAFAPRAGGVEVRRWLAAAGAALAMAAAVVLLLRTAADGDVRTKGGAHVGFFVKRGDAVTEGVNGQGVRAGDRVRFVVTTDRDRHLGIVSLDSRGVVSVFSPSRVASVPVRAGVGEALEGSIELDDSPGTERIFAVFCDAPFEVRSVARELERTRELSSLPGCVVDRLELTKEKAP